MRTLELLEHQRGAAFCDHKAIATLIEWAREATCRERSHVRERGDSDRRGSTGGTHRGLGTTGNDYVAATRGDEACCITYRLGRGGTRGHHRLARSPKAEAHRYRCRACVGHHHGHETGRDATRPLLDQHRHLFLQCLESADASCED